MGLSISFEAGIISRVYGVAAMTRRGYCTRQKGYHTPAQGGEREKIHKKYRLNLSSVVNETNGNRKITKLYFTFHTFSIEC